MAKKKFFLQSTTAKGLRFDIVKLDRTSMRATLKGPTGVEFEQTLTQDNLDKFGYEVRQDVNADAAVPAEQE